jgi:GT2 family glycosyltransferase
MPDPVVSVVVPTRGREEYLDVTLASLRGQDLDEAYELLVVNDSAAQGIAAVAEGHGVRVLGHGERRGANAARNTGLRETASKLVAFVDDDVDAPAGWLRALVDGARRHPDAGAFGGPIRARLEGRSPRACGRENPPITTLDLGDRDRETDVVWSANMMVRRSAVEQVGEFDETIFDGGEEQEWFERLRAAGGTVMYLAQAALDHRRAGDDLRLRSLARAAYVRGRAVRRFDRRRGIAPPLRGELRVLGGCGWHTVRRGCSLGIVMGAHSLGRTVEAIRGR